MRRQFNLMRVLQFLCALLLAFAGVVISACEQSVPAPSSMGSAPITVREVESPAGRSSREPKLFAAADGQLILSWLEKIAGNRYALRFSTRSGNVWTEPRTVAEGSNWFVNWADFPSVIKLPDGALVAHWLVKSGSSTYAYDVNIACSSDEGRTWESPVVPHRDGTQTEHGFVSLLSWTSGRAAAVWLDGRKFKSQENARLDGAQVINAHHGHDSATNEMTLRFAAIGADGKLSEEAELDARVCDCCQTAAVLTPEGAIVVYRNRSNEEVRDISIVRYRDGRWTEPQPVHRDGWQISGCPVNGPALATEGRRVAVAWFTQAQERPQVKVIFSEDAGATFGQPIEMASDSTLGRVDVAMLADGSALVSWMEGTAQSAIIKVRRVRPDGSCDEPFTIAETSAARTSGFPRMARIGEEVLAHV